ncbi:MAG: DUF2752 domain-containing protein [Thermoguttaceae bacterium]
MAKKRSTAGIILTVILLLTGITIGLCLYFEHPAKYTWLPSCPFRVCTGLLCSGCGTLRAIHYILNGQLDIAFRCQPLLFFLSPILVLLAGKVCYENLRNTTVTLPYELQIYCLILIAICLFFLLRNIPLDCFECLRPPDLTTVP